LNCIRKSLDFLIAFFLKPIRLSAGVVQFLLFLQACVCVCVCVCVCERVFLTLASASAKTTH
jgi:hypothetical protein